MQSLFQGTRLGVPPQLLMTGAFATGFPVFKCNVQTQNRPTLHIVIVNTQISLTYGSWNPIQVLPSAWLLLDSVTFPPLPTCQCGSSVSFHPALCSSHFHAPRGLTELISSTVSDSCEVHLLLTGGLFPVATMSHCFQGGRGDWSICVALWRNG